MLLFLSWFLARINDDSDNEESDDEIDYPEEDDEELLFDEDASTSYQSRNQKVALGNHNFYFPSGQSMIFQWRTPQEIIHLEQCNSWKSFNVALGNKHLSGLLEQWKMLPKKLMELIIKLLKEKC